MALGRYLADKSAFEQQRHSEAAAGLLSALAADGALFMTEIIALELLYSARSSDDYDVRREDLLSLPWFHLTQSVAARALTIQHELAGRGQHRRPIPDLLVRPSNTTRWCSTTTGTSISSLRSPVFRLAGSSLLGPVTPAPSDVGDTRASTSTRRRNERPRRGPGEIEMPSKR